MSAQQRSDSSYHPEELTAQKFLAKLIFAEVR